MKAHVNGQPTQLPDGITIAELLRDLGLQGRRVAIEINGEIVPRSRHDEHRLVENDVLEIVHAIGGG